MNSEQNKLLSQVSAGTQMGSLLRRYWWPIAAVTEFDEKDIKPVRLLGEDLVLYRDKSLTFGLIDKFCPHRGMNLEYGMVEACGLRCPYHGWKFDESGSCTEQPFEQSVRPDSRFLHKTKIKAYPVKEKAGLLWAYLGPNPAPCLWDWELYSERGFKQIVFTELACNWFQCQENAIDPVHFEWLHSNWTNHMRGQPYGPRHKKIGFDEFEWGFIYRRVYEHKTEEDDDWRVGRVCLWPNGLYVGSFEWSVPIDDERTLRVRWSNDALPGNRPFHQEKIPHWYAAVADPRTAPRRGAPTTHQDFAAFLGQGTVADRTREHLGESDRGVVMMRKRFVADLKRIENGLDPKGILRDPDRNERIPLPTSSTDQRALGSTLSPSPMGEEPDAIAEERKRVWAAHSLSS